MFPSRDQSALPLRSAGIPQAFEPNCSRCRNGSPRGRVATGTPDHANGRSQIQPIEVGYKSTSRDWHWDIPNEKSEDNSEKQKGRRACGHPPILRLGVGEDRFTQERTASEGGPCKGVCADGGSILAECL